MLLFLLVRRCTRWRADEYNEEQLSTASRRDALQYMATSRFWFESFQNWQSEFLVDRARWWSSPSSCASSGSPESKPVDAPHHEQTGGE